MENIPQSPNQSFDLTMSDGAIIRIRRYGNTDGVRLFLTHGNGFAIDGYYPYWKLLIERFDLIVFDMRNHGINPFSGADGHHYAQLSNDIGSIYHGVTNELGHKTSVGVFHSFSARAAMKHATQGRERTYIQIVNMRDVSPCIPTNREREVSRACASR